MLNQCLVSNLPFCPLPSGVLHKLPLFYEVESGKVLKFFSLKETINWSVKMVQLK